MLRRETITMEVNKVTHSVENRIESKSNITSHSFRIGYITSLWRGILDIKFGKQTIGHATIDTTSRYIENLSEEERKSGMNSIIFFNKALFLISAIIFSHLTKTIFLRIPQRLMNVRMESVNLMMDALVKSHWASS